jgi:hypothetical protein
MQKKLVGFLGLTMLAASLTAGTLPKELSDLFRYDKKAALNVQETSTFNRDGVTVRDILFDSPKGGRVPAYIVEPTCPGLNAGIVFGHWGGGVRTEFLNEAIFYARAGAVSVLIDYPWVRPAPWRRNINDFGKPEQDREAYIQAVLDLRRAFDILEARSDVDKNRMGYVGHSYGAQWGAILSAVDGRLQTAVLVAGIPDYEVILLSDNPDILELRKQLPLGQLEGYVKTVSVLDAIRYVPHAAPKPLFFQFALHERSWGKNSMERYAGAASEPKKVEYYETGHEVNDIKAVADRAFWLEKHLRLHAVLPLLKAKIVF